MDALWIVLVSLGLQLAAVVLTLRLIRITGGRAAWIVIATGVLLMALRRAITLHRILSGDLSKPPDPTVEWIALAISLLMLVGIALIGPLFRTYQRSQAALEHSEAARRQLEEQFLQSQKLEALGRLAGGVAHDFNNLLTVILGFTDAALRDLPRDHRTVGHLREVRQATVRATDLTRRLLAFSRQQPVRPEVLDLNQTVVRAEEMLRRVLGKDIQLSTQLDPAVPRVLADVGQMDHVLMNLVVNARDAMPNGGQLAVQTAAVTLRTGAEDGLQDSRPGRYAVLSVRDSGIGMDASTQARAFEPFFTTKEPGKGTGLGLSTVFGIVKQAGGFMRVQSQPGVGSTFEVYLPATNAPHTPTASPPPTPRGREAVTVLVVEDDPLIRDLVCKVLLQRGAQVLGAAGRDEALAASRAHVGPIDLLLTDSMVTHGGVSELAARLQAERPSMRVLVLSGYPADDSRDGTGFPFLSKPFSVEALLRKVDEVTATEPIQGASSPSV